jgi:hypothetical protein
MKTFTEKKGNKTRQIRTGNATKQRQKVPYGNDEFDNKSSKYSRSLKGHSHEKVFEFIELNHKIRCKLRYANPSLIFKIARRIAKVF